MKEHYKLLLVFGVFLAAFFLPIEKTHFQRALLEGFFLLKDYARQHVLLCLVPAFFIAGAIATFLRKESVLRYLGPDAPKSAAYGVASVSGSLLAVCSCTVLPLFAGLYRRGAGLGPAIAFLYSGPVINVLAIILTARVLGFELGVVRALGAVGLSILVGLLMAFAFRNENKTPQPGGLGLLEETHKRRSWQEATFLAVLIGILVFANWATPKSQAGFFAGVYRVRWFLVAALGLGLLYQIRKWFGREERLAWVMASWDFAKQILPLLAGGILVSGWALGRPGVGAGLIPATLVQELVGGNSFLANLMASVIGAFFYFATLTEVPILQTLLGAGMGKGPALALLLAGPALSLPSMLVVSSYLGARKTFVYYSLVVAISTMAGMVYGRASA